MMKINKFRSFHKVNVTSDQEKHCSLCQLSHYVHAGTACAFKIYSLVGNIKLIFVKYFMQHIRNGLIIFLINSFENNIC